MSMKRIAVFASGNGSNFEAIAAACERGEIPARIALAVCDKPEARVVERAANHGVECFVFRPKEYGSKADYEREIVRRLDAAQVDLVCLAGYMRLCGEELLGAYGGRIINIHPALLPRSTAGRSSPSGLSPTRAATSTSWRRWCMRWNIRFISKRSENC